MFNNKFLAIAYNQTASSSMNAENLPIKNGKATTRLKLVDEDPRFYISVKKIKNNKIGIINRIRIGLNLYVKVQDKQGNWLLININSAASRLHLTKNQVKEVVLAEDLALQANRISTIFFAHKKITEYANKSYPVNVSLSLKLMDQLKSIDNAASNKIEFNGKTYLISPPEQDPSKGQKVDIHYINKVLGAGTFGKVYTLSDVIDQKNEDIILKLAKKEKGAEAIEELKNEYEMLKEIQYIGIQFLPKKIVRINTIKNENFVGYLGIKYDGDYYKDTKKYAYVSIKQRLFEFYQLLSGLKYLEEKNILHGDLKSENIFVKGSGYNKLVHIADFGGAKNINHCTLDELIDMPLTPEFTSKRDFQKQEKYFQQKNKHAYIEVAKKRDVFAMGRIMYEAFNLNKDPYPFYSILNEDGTVAHFLAAIDKDYQEINNPRLPQEIKDLIKRMLDPNYETRISASEAFARFDSYIKLHHIDIYQAIKKLSCETQ